MKFFQSSLIFLTLSLSIYCVYNILTLLPFYYSPDSNYHYALEVLKLKDGLFPGHLLHPNLIPLFFFKYVFLPLEQFFGLTNITSLVDLKNFTNPFLEFIPSFHLTRWIFFIFGSLLGGLLLYLLLQTLLKQTFESTLIPNHSKVLLHLLTTSFAFLFFILSSDLLLSSFKVIRFETFGIPFGIASLLFAHLASSSKHSQKRENQFILLSGLFLGLSFFSKMSAFTLIPLVFTLYFIDKQKPQPLTKKEKNVSLIISIYLLTLFIIGTTVVSYMFSHNIIRKIFYVFDTPNKKLYTHAIAFGTFLLIGTLILSTLSEKKTALQHLFQKLAFYWHKALLFALGFTSVLWATLLMDEPIQWFTIVYYFTFGMGFMEAQDYLATYVFLPSIQTLYPLFLLSSTLLIFTTKDRKLLKPFVFSLTLIVSYLLSVFSPRVFQHTLPLSIAIFIISLILYWQDKYETQPHNINKLWKKILLSPILLSLALTLLFIRLSQDIPINNVIEKNIVKTERVSVNEWLGTGFSEQSGTLNHLIQLNYPSEQKKYQIFYWATQINDLKFLFTMDLDIPQKLGNTSLVYPKQPLSIDGAVTLTSASTPLIGGLTIDLDKQGFVRPRFNYNYYVATNETMPLATDNEKLIKLSIKTPLLFTVNNVSYTVYKLIYKDTGGNSYVQPIPKNGKKYLIITPATTF